MTLNESINGYDVDECKQRGEAFASVRAHIHTHRNESACVGLAGGAAAPGCCCCSRSAGACGGGGGAENDEEEDGAVTSKP